MKFLWTLLASLGLAFTAHGGELKDLPGKPAAKLVLPALAGDTVDLAQLRGKVVLVNFWAAWCPPCRKEMPSMNRLAKGLAGQPFVILGVNAGDEPEAIQAFLKHTPVEFPILLDTEGTSLKPWQAFVFPTSFVVDKQGRLRMGLVGSIEWDAPETVARIQALMAEAP
ncbi:MAG: TlpA disulfide reductase family protein [Pseudomonadota bacterium]